MLKTIPQKRFLQILLLKTCFPSMFDMSTMWRICWNSFLGFWAVSYGHFLKLLPWVDIVEQLRHATNIFLAHCKHKVPETGSEKLFFQKCLIQQEFFCSKMVKNLFQRKNCRGGGPEKIEEAPWGGSVFLRSVFLQSVFLQVAKFTWQYALRVSLKLS